MMLAASGGLHMFQSIATGGSYPMNKLKLNLEMLKVETFAATRDDDEPGTVVAHSGWTNCGGLTCLMSLCPDCAVAAK